MFCLWFNQLNSENVLFRKTDCNLQEADSTYISIQPSQSKGKTTCGWHQISEASWFYAAGLQGSVVGSQVFFFPLSKTEKSTRNTNSKTVTLIYHLSCVCLNSQFGSSALLKHTCAHVMDTEELLVWLDQIWVKLKTNVNIFKKSV